MACAAIPLSVSRRGCAGVQHVLSALSLKWVVSVRRMVVGSSGGACVAFAKAAAVVERYADIV